MIISKAFMRSFPILAVLTAISFAGPTPDQEGVPFSGDLEGTVARSGTPPIVSVNVDADGTATQLGKFALTIPHTVDLTTRTATGAYVFVAANGDTLLGTFVGHSTATETPTVLQIVEVVTITGGTGRFAGAEGSFTCVRQYDMIAGTTIGSFDGTITTPGSKRH